MIAQQARFPARMAGNSVLRGGTQQDDGQPPTDRPATARDTTARCCRAITEARWFAVTVFCLILANAALLDAETPVASRTKPQQPEPVSAPPLATGTSDGLCFLPSGAGAAQVGGLVRDG